MSPIRAGRAAAAALCLVLLPWQPASADDSLTSRALQIVNSVASGDPLRVVLTSASPDGSPRFTTTAATTRAKATDLVRAALSAGRTVSMAQPVRTTLSRDTYRSRQWALDALKAESVWKVTQGGTSSKLKSKRVVVAVVDTGVATDHPDLKANLVAGHDVLAPKTSPYDENGHGTHVAGIIAAVAGNKRGIAGLAPRAAVMPVRVLDRNGAGSTDDVARGIVWAVDHGARVVNLSLASPGSDAALQRAVAYAQAKGAVVVAAAGNDGGTLRCFLLGCARQYPAAYPGVIGVAALDSGRTASSFSSYGSWVDVAAPGAAVISLTPKTNRLGCGTSTYCTMSGTSMAAPYVSASVALARSNHSWSAATTASRVQSTATDLGARGRDASYGYGLVNPLALVKAR